MFWEQGVVGLSNIEIICTRAEFTILKLWQLYLENIDHLDKNIHTSSSCIKILLPKLFTILPEYLEFGVFLVSDIQYFWNCKFVYIYTNKYFKAMINSDLCIILINLSWKLKGVNCIISKKIQKILFLYS